MQQREVYAAALAPEHDAFLYNYQCKQAVPVWMGSPM